MKRFTTVLIAIAFSTLVLQVATAWAADARGHGGTFATQKPHFSGTNRQEAMRIELSMAGQKANARGTSKLSRTGAAYNPLINFPAANATSGPCVPSNPSGPLPIPYPLTLAKNKTAVHRDRSTDREIIVSKLSDVASP